MKLFPLLRFDIPLLLHLSPKSPLISSALDRRILYNLWPSSPHPLVFYHLLEQVLCLQYDCVQSKWTNWHSVILSKLRNYFFYSIIIIICLTLGALHPSFLLLFWKLQAIPMASRLASRHLRRYNNDSAPLQFDDDLINPDGEKSADKIIFSIVCKEFAIRYIVSFFFFVLLLEINTRQEFLLFFR